MSFLKDITTCKDNRTFEIVRVVIVAMLISFLLILFTGVFCFVRAWHDGKPFDIMTLFNAVGIVYSSFTLFLGGCAGAIKWKETTEPDNSNNGEKQ